MRKQLWMDLDSIFPDDFIEEDQIVTIIREHWLDIDYRINSDRSIDVYGNVKFPDFASFLTELPLKFNQVHGDFDITALVNLTTLKGGPVEVGGTFNCAYTNIKTLEYAPKLACKMVFDNNIKSLSTNWNCDYKQVHIIFRSSNPVDGLPSAIIEHVEDLPTILKYQNYFEVWNNDGSFNEKEFNDLIAEIKEGLG